MGRGWITPVAAEKRDYKFSSNSDPPIFHSFPHAILVVYSHLNEVTPQRETRRSRGPRPSPTVPPGGADRLESRGRGRVAGSAAAETTATSQLMKASIHLHSHNIHARGRLPQRKQAPFKEKTIGPPQQIPANLPGPGRQERRDASDGRLPV